MYIVRETATKNDPTSNTWITNGAGVQFSRWYGFGRINAGTPSPRFHCLSASVGTSHVCCALLVCVLRAEAAVARALTWTAVGALTASDSTSPTLNLDINGRRTTSSRLIVQNSVNYIEHVMVRVFASRLALLLCRFRERTRWHVLVCAGVSECVVRQWRAGPVHPSHFAAGHYHQFG
jgi:hypothetical protein